jgi:hypothetical protein
MKKSTYIFVNLATAFFLVAIAAMTWNCEPKNSGSFYPNQQPITRLSNVPPPDDTTRTTSPRVSLNWVGDDPDGYVVGFRYRWNFRLSQTHPFEYKPYSIILNIIINKFALMVTTEEPHAVPPVYKYFATLPPEGLGLAQIDSLARGDTIRVEGIGVFASNPDSIRIQTGARIRYSFPVHINPNSGTFIFDSQDTINFHTFEITAIDNLGDTSSFGPPNIRRISFETPQVPPPVTSISNYRTDTTLVVMHQTPTFNGLLFRFVGNDPNSRTIDYRWVVDKSLREANHDSVPWSKFSQLEYAYVVASDFVDPYATEHEFTVQARNEFGSIDTIGATVTFRTIYPPFARGTGQLKILFLNIGYPEPPVPPLWPGTIAYPYREMVDDYYHNIFNGLGIPDSLITTWHIKKDPPGDYPSLGEIGKYNLLFLYGDVVLSEYYMYGNYPAFGGSRQNIIRDYCYVGGNFITSGWALVSPYNTPQQPEFQLNILHVNISAGQNAQAVKSYEFAGAYGSLGYPDIMLDTTKCDTAWRNSPTSPIGLTNIWTCSPYGFGEIIHNFKSTTKSPFSADGRILSIRYQGITFNAIYFGFPLYYMERPAADSTIAKALRDAIDWKGAVR